MARWHPASYFLTALLALCSCPELAVPKRVSVSSGNGDVGRPRSPSLTRRSSKRLREAAELRQAEELREAAAAEASRSSQAAEGAAPAAKAASRPRAAAKGAAQGAKAAKGVAPAAAAAPARQPSQTPRALRRRRDLQSCGPWAPSSPGLSGAHKWLANIAKYALNFDSRKLNFGGGEATQQRSFVFGGMRSRNDFFHLCLHMDFHDTFAVGQLTPWCKWKGCTEVVEVLQEDLRAFSEPGRAAMPPMLCNFSFGNEECPQNITWSIVAGGRQRLFEIPLAQVAPVDTPVQWREARSRQLRLQASGPWVPSNHDDSAEHPWHDTMVHYGFNFDIRKVMSDLPAGKKRRRQQQMVFGGLLNPRDFLFPCTQLVFYETYVLGDLTMACWADGCTRSIMLLANLDKSSGPDDFARPLLKCRFPLSADAPHMGLVWEILSADCFGAARHCPPIQRIPLEPDLMSLARREIADQIGSSV